jgi:hypothetical protein
MCYSIKSSLTTFLIVFSVCIYLWIKGGDVKKSIAVILFFISLMQLVELFIWLNIKCSNTNKLISLFIPILLFFQPIIVITTIIYFNSGRLPIIFYKIILIIWLLCSPIFINSMKNGFNKCTIVGKNGYLVWPYTNSSKPMDEFIQNLYNLVLGIGIGTLNTRWYGIFYIVMSIFSYNYIKKIYGHSWGSIWCNFINILSLGALFIK